MEEEEMNQTEDVRVEAGQDGSPDHSGPGEDVSNVSREDLSDMPGPEGDKHRGEHVDVEEKLVSRHQSEAPGQTASYQTVQSGWEISG